MLVALSTTTAFELELSLEVIRDPYQLCRVSQNKHARIKVKARL